MRPFIKLLILLLLPFYVTAQNIPVKVTKSEVFKEKSSESKIELVESDGKDGLLIIRSFTKIDIMLGTSKKGYYFEHYDSAMKLINEYEYSLDAKQTVKFSSILGMITHNDQLHVIDFKYSKEDKAYICSAWTSKIGDFNFSPKELFRVKSEELKQGSNYSIGGFFFGANYKSAIKMILNDEKNAFAISINIDEEKNKTQKLFLFDNLLNKKIEHTYKRDISAKDFRLQNMEVSKDGKAIYLLGKIAYSKNKKTKEEARTEFELSRITNDEEKSVVLDTDAISLLSIKFSYFDDKLVCVGFYSESDKVDFKGVAYFELDPLSLQINKSKLNPFSDQFIIDKFGKSKDKNVGAMNIKKLQFTSNKELIINAEESYSITYTKSSGGSTSMNYYNDIILAKLDQNGEMLWARNINKKSKTSGINDTSFLSYVSILKNNDTYIFVNSAGKINKLSNNRIEFELNSFNDANLNLIKTDANGNISYQEILNDKDLEVPIMVRNGQISDGSMYFMGRKGSKKQLFKITL